MGYNETSLNSHWPLKKLNQIGEFKRGKSKHRPRNDSKLFLNGKIPLIQTGDIKAANLYIEKATEFYNEVGLKQSKLWDEDTLCITIAANIAETAILKKKMCFPDSVVGFIPFKKETTSVFMHYLFAFIRQRIQNSVQGSIQDNINIDYLEKLQLRIPEFPTQQKIVSVLSALDDKIELNNKINVELESMTKTLYDYWFVQFDFPDANGKPYKSSGGKMVWDEALKREIPMGWEVCCLSDIANITMGQSPPGESYNEDGSGCVFYQGSTDFGNRYPTIRKFTTSPSRFATQGDILLSVRAPVGTMNVAKEDCCIGRGLAALNSKDNCMSYLYEVMIDLKQIFDRRNVNGTTFGSITKDDLFSLKVVRPSSKILEKYNTITKPCFEKQNKMGEENQELTQLRDWLLPMLMNGQVTVGETEEKMGMVAEGSMKYK
ncbi:restriction endonuclease subunit S [Flavobacterium sp. DGU11]|uniref:Restriction endonuclease subunit S n=1 Tax=Flavobacterium arundinis TaxID=3139143 RepID=A0ABU9HUM7_9FLAO